MLLRRDGDRKIAIPQPAHAGLAGRLAGAWGNADFPAPGPETVLAATLHDIGWAPWERAPTRDPATGWPLAFSQVSPVVHVDLWREGVAQARLFGRWPALLVSCHADTIYSRHYDPAAATAEERAAVRTFLDEQHALQAGLATSLQSDPSAGDASREAIERARLFVAAVDELSLHLCWGVERPVEVAEVPAAGGRTAVLSLRPAHGDAVTLTPWPFGAARLAIDVEGRVLASPFPCDDALRRGLAEAPVATLRADLVPEPVDPASTPLSCA